MKEMMENAFDNRIQEMCGSLEKSDSLDVTVAKKRENI